MAQPKAQWAHQHHERPKDDTAGQKNECWAQQRCEQPSEDTKGQTMTQPIRFSDITLWTLSFIW